MKLFLDTAEVDQIRKYVPWGVVDGVTTNPSLVAKSGRVFEDVIREICGIVDGPVSAEVTATDADGMVREGLRLAAIHRNVVVKVPLIEAGLVATKALTARGIRTNVTLCFSANQAILAAKAGASFVSPFIGRLDDIGQRGMDVIADIMAIYRQYPTIKTEVIVASVRHPEHTREASRLGAHICTVPPKLLDQMVAHPMTEKGLAAFLADWEKAKKSAQTPISSGAAAGHAAPAASERPAAARA
jgi:transaldolase